MLNHRLITTCLYAIVICNTLNHQGANSSRSILSRPMTQSAYSSLTQVVGIGYGPYRQHESPDGLQPTKEEIQEDLKLLKAILPPPRRIRIYSSSGPGKLAAIIAAEEGFLVTLGAWIDEHSDKHQANIAELASLAELVPIVHPEMVIVGNETLLRINTDNKTTEVEKREARLRLQGYLRSAKAALPATIISTAEPWATWVDDPTGAQLVGLVDVLTVHVHPFWEKTPIEEAAGAVFGNFNKVKSLGKPVILGETGWPSNGEPQQNEKDPQRVAVPSPENQRAFILRLLHLAGMQNERIFLFSAFDEPFKGVADRGSDTDAAAEGSTGANWGLFFWNRKLKPWLADIFGNPGEPDPASSFFRILARGWLAPGLDLGIDTERLQRDWIKKLEAEESGRSDGAQAFRLAFPDNQCWGSVFITTRKPTPDIQVRRVTDVTGFDRIALDLRLIDGSDGIEVALKNPERPDDGTESKVIVEGLTQQWQTVVIPLSWFSPTDLKRLYVVAGLNFVGMTGKIVDVAEIKLLPQSATINSSLTPKRLLSRSNLDHYILKQGALSCGYGLGIATESPLLLGWLQSKPGYLRLSYPGGRAWASAFFTIGNPPPTLGNKLTTDWTGKAYLAVEIRGKQGGELCYIGVRSSRTSQFSQSLARTSFRLSTNWTWVYIPLNSIPSFDLSRIQVVASIELDGPASRTIDIRDIRVLSS